jgi:hypothetical protein
MGDSLYGILSIVIRSLIPPPAGQQDFGEEFGDSTELAEA